MKIPIPKGGLVALFCAVAFPAQAQVFGGGVVAGGPNYLVRYFEDLRYRDVNNNWILQEQGIFDTASEGNRVVNHLAHLRIAYRVDCGCQDIRRDAIGAIELEESLVNGLPSTGYNPRLIPADQVGGLPARVIASPPYVRFPGFGSVTGRNAGGYATSSFDPNDDRLYARGTDESVFQDTRIVGRVRARIGQIMGGLDINDPGDLCAYARNVHDDGTLISTLLIEDLRRTWGTP